MDTESLIHQVTENESIIGYVLLSPDGIPIKHDERMPYATAVLYASLVTEFYTRSSFVMRELSETESTGGVRSFSFRTKERTEIIVAVNSEYLLVVIQNCTGKPWKWPDGQGKNNT